MSINEAAAIAYGTRVECVGCKGPTEYADQILHAGMCGKCRKYVTDKVKEQLGAKQ